jgi:hypothetical protein
MRSRHGLAGVRGDSRVGQPCGRGRRPGSRRCGWLAGGYGLRGSGIPGGASLAGVRCRDVSYVVPQGRPDDLPAPFRTGPPGKLGPRQHLVYPRGVSLGDLEPDGDPGRIRQPRTRHAFKVPGTDGLKRERWARDLCRECRSTCVCTASRRSHVVVVRLGSQSDHAADR